jgi:hypothetical protein
MDLQASTMSLPSPQEEGTAITTTALARVAGADTLALIDSVAVFQRDLLAPLRDRVL